VINSRIVSYPVAEGLEAKISEVVEVLNDISIEPTSTVVLQWLRQFPVVNSDHWFNASSQQTIDDLVVVSDTGLIDAIRQLTSWNNTRPRQGKPIEVHLYAKARSSIIYDKMKSE